MEGSRMEEREARRENVQLEKKGVKYRRDGEEDSPRRVGRLPPARSAGNERGWRTQSVSNHRSEGKRERGKAKSCGIYVAVAVTPLPNYYLVIFLSECSVNALHRNTANRGGWIDRPSVASKVSVMWTLHLKNIRSVASQTNAIKAEGTLCKAAAAARSPKQG